MLKNSVNSKFETTRALKLDKKLGKNLMHRIDGTPDTFSDGEIMKKKIEIFETVIFHVR